MDIHQLIERYFTGDTSLQEEATLRHLLADPSYTGTDVDEARAVMGFFFSRRRRSTSHPPRRQHHSIAVAAALAPVIFASILWWGTGAEPPGDVCVAYVNGRELHGAEAMERMKADISMFAEASSEVSSGISEDFAVFDDL